MKQTKSIQFGDIVFIARFEGSSYLSLDIDVVGTKIKPFPHELDATEVEALVDWLAMEVLGGNKIPALQELIQKSSVLDKPLKIETKTPTEEDKVKLQESKDQAARKSTFSRPLGKGEKITVKPGSGR